MNRRCELFKRKVYVKPAMGGWVVLEMTVLGSFFDDLMTFDPLVAIHNLILELRNRSSEC